MQPDLVLMDLRMPKMDGIEATRAIKTEFPRIVVLMLTAVEEPNSLLDALRVGAAGYILKGSAPRQIADSIRRAMAGESPLNEEIAMRLIVRMMGEEESTETIQGAPPTTLTISSPQDPQRTRPILGLPCWGR